MSMYEGEIVPATPEAEFTAWKQDIERRLRALENSPALPFSSSRGGTINWRDADNSRMSTFGKFNDGSTTFQGLVQYDLEDKATFMTRSDKKGIIHPEFQAVFVPMNSFVGVTSGTFVPTHNMNPTHIYHDVLRVVFTVISGASTVGEVRLREVNTNQSTDVITTTAGQQELLGFEWIHPAGVGAQGNPNFLIEARRVSGANSVDVYMPREGQLTSSALIPGANTNGNPIIF